MGPFGSYPNFAAPRRTFRAASLACVWFAAAVAAFRGLAIACQCIFAAKTCRKCGERNWRRKFGATAALAWHAPAANQTSPK